MRPTPEFATGPPRLVARFPLSFYNSLVANKRAFSAWDERERLSALKSYHILDTPPEPEFDDVVRLAAQVCATPIAVIALFQENRQWLKAEIGLGLREMPLKNSIYAHSILQSSLFVISDATRDLRFKYNKLVIGEPYVRFYAGVPLQTSDGLPLGTLCVIDRRPRELTKEQAFTLRTLARQVMAQLELRRALIQRDEALAAQNQAEIALRELNLSLERRIEAGTREIERMGEANRRAAIIRERLRIARDLHSTLAHSLLALLAQIRLTRKLTHHDPAAVEAELARAEDVAQEGLIRARMAITELRYQTMGEKGLGPALERLTAQLREKTSLEITLHVDSAAAGLADETAEVLYRIAEEAVHNVEHHSAAERVDVSVRVGYFDGAERLTLTVADDGVGFDPGTAPSDHYGLTGMREQAELIGAELRLDSAPGQGTRVSVSVPV